MQKIYAFFVDFFVGRQETGNLNETALIIVLVILIVALLISIRLAKKNNLYNKHVQKDDQIIHNS